MGELLKDCLALASASKAVFLRVAVAFALTNSH